MSHPEQQDFVRWVKERHPQYFTNKKVLEVGSMDINGSVRPFFKGCMYTGIDLGPGPGVDLVVHVADLYMRDYPYDVIISCEALEHDVRWYTSLVAMQELLRPGGLLLATCAGPGREEHGTTGSAPECSPHTPGHYKNLGRADIEPLLHFPAVWSCPPKDTRFYMIMGML